MTGTDRTALYYAAIISLGGFLFGFDAAVISGVVGFITPLFDLDEAQIGLVVSAPSLAAIIAALTVGPAADQVGRKKVMLVLALLYTISATASAIAPDITTLIVARFVGGLAFGTLMLAPIYIAEIAPARLRGRMVSVNQLNIVIGFSAAYFANYFILNASESGAPWVAATGVEEHAWRWMLGLEALPAAAYFLLMFLVPESPRWLVLHGKTDRAATILARITEPANIQPMLEEIASSATGAIDSLWSRLKALLKPELRLVLVVGFIVGIAQQASGINSVYFYAPTIFEQSGVGTNAAFMQATYIGIINVVFTIIAMLTIDRFGRKPLLLLGLLGVFVSMSVTAYGFHTATYEMPADRAAEFAEQFDAPELAAIGGIRFDNDLEFKGALIDIIGRSALRANESALIEAAIRINPRIVLAGILGFVASFAFSLGPVMWVLFSEIFPNRIRGVAMAVMGVVNSGVSTGVQFIFPWELANFGTAMTFLIYGVVSLVCLVLVAKLLPETRGRTLEELERELVRPRPASA